MGYQLHISSHTRELSGGSVAFEVGDSCLRRLVQSTKAFSLDAFTGSIPRYSLKLICISKQLTRGWDSEKEERGNSRFSDFDSCPTICRVKIIGPNH